MTHQSESNPVTASLVRRSIWHWDLWAAITAGLVGFLGWMLTDYEADWRWIVPIMGLSVTMAGLAWSQWNSLRTRLRGSDYGELLRLSDESETEVKMPYFVTLFVALTSAFWSTGTATIIEAVNYELAEAVLLGVTVFLATWSGLGMVSLAIHSAAHDKMMAQIESMREEMEATERRYKTENARAGATDEKEPEEETR